MSAGLLLIAALLAPNTGTQLSGHVASPGDGRVAVEGGVDGVAPTGEVRIGISRQAVFALEGVWSPDAPLVGGTLQIAAGRPRESIFAHAWLQGLVRPVLTTAVQDTFSGAQTTVGLGFTWWPDPFVLTIEGGVALGIPISPFDGEVVGSTIDQRKGFFTVQEVSLGIELGEHLQLSGWANFNLPLSALDLERPEEEFLDAWEARFGGRVALRW
ncbi:MAG: hypothetical protein ACE366_24160 [Bradymonadia bacterium]